jgi:RNA polymerase-binding transcription factor DksA
MIEIREQLAEQMAAAFAHLEAGLYGYCHDCHASIPLSRLDALPFSIRCATCDAARPEPMGRQMRLAVA